MLNLWVCDEEGQEGVGKPSDLFEPSHGHGHGDRWEPYEPTDMYQKLPAQTAHQPVGSVYSYRHQTADTASNCPSGDARQFDVPVVSIGGSVADTKSHDYETAADSMFIPSNRNFYKRQQKYKHLKQQQGQTFRTAQAPCQTGHFFSLKNDNHETNANANDVGATSMYGYQQCQGQNNSHNIYENQSQYRNHSAIVQTDVTSNTGSSSNYGYNQYNQNQISLPVVPATCSHYSYGKYPASQQPSHCNDSSYEYNSFSQPESQNKSHYGSYSDIDIEQEPQWHESAPQQVEAPKEPAYTYDIDIDMPTGRDAVVKDSRPAEEEDQQQLSSSPDAATADDVSDASFLDMYQSLCLFSKTYGHTNVPRGTSWFLLGQWVESLRKRKRFRILQARGINVASNLQCPLSDHEITLLENIGFSWNATAAEDIESIIAEMKSIDNSIVQQASARSRNSPQANIMPETKPKDDVQVDMPLDFDVPNGDNIGNMNDLLKDYALVETSQTNCENPLPPPQPIAFRQDPLTDKTPDSVKSNGKGSREKGDSVAPVEVSSCSDSESETMVEQMWSSQYKRLTAYKRTHGNTAVPARYTNDPKLGHWVMTQRRQYQLLQKGKASRMTKERAGMLNQLGFKWSIRTNPRTMWNTRLQELTDYKDEHGDCLVPQRYTENTQLGIWVNTQRRHYKLLKEGKKSCMTLERLEKLNKVGFSWSKLGTKDPKKA